MGAKYVGAIVRRQENPRYLTGRGRFVDDMTAAGCLHAAVGARHPALIHSLLSNR